MGVKIEAGKGWLCALGYESGMHQAMAEELPQPIFTGSARFMQLSQDSATVNIYFADETVNIETKHWSKAKKPEKESGIVLKWKTNLKEIQATGLGYHKYSMFGGPATIEFGNPADSDYLKVVSELDGKDN